MLIAYANHGATGEQAQSSRWLFRPVKNFVQLRETFMSLFRMLLNYHRHTNLFPNPDISQLINNFSAGRALRCSAVDVRGFKADQVFFFLSSLCFVVCCCVLCFLTSHGQTRQSESDKKSLLASLKAGNWNNADTSTRLRQKHKKRFAEILKNGKANFFLFHWNFYRKHQRLTAHSTQFVQFMTDNYYVSQHGNCVLESSSLSNRCRSSLSFNATTQNWWILNHRSSQVVDIASETILT